MRLLNSSNRDGRLLPPSSESLYLKSTVVCKTRGVQNLVNIATQHLSETCRD